MTAWKLAPGTQLGHYEILGLLGAGGMGQVYRARDPRLGRDVAIKVLLDDVAADAGGRDRFEREARAIAALSHPNVLAIFDIGTADQRFIVTELLDGETLRARLTRERLPGSTAMQIIAEVASGLHAAHQRGIVHRDLKPENIFLTRSGVTKILDFGLAKSTASVAGAPLDATVLATGTLVVGTAGYMAPEQVRGAGIDARTDIFALGAVLYEMLTGRRAFEGSSPADTMSAVLLKQPPNPTVGGVSPTVARIVTRCLEKQPEQRFQTAQELAAALVSAVEPRGGRASADDAPSIAVLPFADMSPLRDQAYFCDGMAEEIITALTRIEGLRVAPRTSTFHARATLTDLPEIGHALGVRHLLEGSVRTAGQRLRVSAQLVDVIDGRNVWSDRFDGEMADVFDIQDSIAQRIVETMRSRLVGAMPEAVRRQYTPVLEAHQLYLKGRHHRFTTYNLRESLVAFQQAAELDAGYAAAHAAVAYTTSVLSNFGVLPPHTAGALARAAIEKALAIEPDSPVAIASLAWDLSLHQRNWSEGDKQFARALALDPSSIEAHAFHGLCCAARHLTDEATAHMERLAALDPLSPFTHGVTALMLLALGRNEDAERASRRALDLRPDSIIALWMTGCARRAVGHYGGSIAIFEQAVTLAKGLYFLRAELACSYAGAGERERAREILVGLDRERETSYVSPFWRGIVLIALGEVDEAFRCFDDAYDEGAPALPYLGVSWWDPIRRDPRFADLARRLGLPPSVAMVR
jgi:TolB-like protein/tetratricopeptide (TPR) repeat protein